MSSKAHLNQVIASHLAEIKADEDPDREIYIFEKGDLGEDVLTYQNIYENSNKIARAAREAKIDRKYLYMLLNKHSITPE